MRTQLVGSRRKERGKCTFWRWWVTPWLGRTWMEMTHGLHVYSVSVSWLSTEFSIEFPLNSILCTSKIIRGLHLWNKEHSQQVVGVLRRSCKTERNRDGHGYSFNYNRLEVFGWVYVRNAVNAVNFCKKCGDCGECDLKNFNDFHRISYQISPRNSPHFLQKFTASTFVAN